VVPMVEVVVAVQVDYYIMDQIQHQKHQMVRLIKHL
jgi:hypothetical protein